MGALASAAAEAMTPPVAETGAVATIVVFGDSITAATQQPEDKRWPAVLARRLQETASDRRIHVINAGGNGDTSREGLARIERDVLAHKPDAVTIEFGGNDVTDEPARHVDLQEFERNLAEMVARIRQANPRTAIVMLTFPTVIDSRHARRSLGGGLDRYIETYREAARRFARRQGLALVDADAVIRPHAADYVLADGVHLTVDGNAALAQAVEPVIRTALAPGVAGRVPRPDGPLGAVPAGVGQGLRLVPP